MLACASRAEGQGGRALACGGMVALGVGLFAAVAVAGAAPAGHSWARTQRRAPSYDLLLGFAPIGARTAWTATRGNSDHNPTQSVQRTVDGGARWSNVTPPGLGRAGRSTTITAVDYASRLRAWIAYGSDEPHSTQTLLTTADGGRVWTRAGTIPTFECGLQFVNPRDGWCIEIDGAAGSAGVVIYRTRTGGRSWREVSHTNVPSGKSSPDAIPFPCEKGIDFASPTEGLAFSHCAGGSGYIYGSTDGGARWTQRHVALLSRPSGDGAYFTSSAASGQDAAAGYTAHGIKTARSVVYHSTDRGQRWSLVSPPGRPRELDVDIVTPSLWRLVAGRTILATDDAGRTWSTIESDTDLSRFDDVSFSTAAVGWAPDPEGNPTALHTTDGGRHWTKVHVPG